MAASDDVSLISMDTKEVETQLGLGGEENVDNSLWSLGTLGEEPDFSFPIDMDAVNLARKLNSAVMHIEGGEFIEQEVGELPEAARLSPARRPEGRKISSLNDGITPENQLGNKQIKAAAASVVAGNPPPMQPGPLASAVDHDGRSAADVPAPEAASATSAVVDPGFMQSFLEIDLHTAVLDGKAAADFTPSTAHEEVMATALAKATPKDA